jgi:hypothetical protein
MSDTISNVQNASLGAGATTGLMTVIGNNATAISVIATVGFGLVYASCAIWNAYSNHRRNKISEDKMIDAIVKRMLDNGETTEAINAVRRATGKSSGDDKESGGSTPV